MEGDNRRMLEDAFFDPVEYLLDFGIAEPCRFELKPDIVEKARYGELNEPDIEVVRPLLELVRRGYINRGNTGYVDHSVAEFDSLRRALQAVCLRLGYDLELPFRNLDSFHLYMVDQYGSDAEETRRRAITEIFDPLEEFVETLENSTMEGILVEGSSPLDPGLWTQVDEEIRALRDKFSSARTASDFSDIGNRAVRIVETLSDLLFDPEKHLREGEDPTAYSKAKTKNRLDRIIENELPGAQNEALRSFAKSCVTLAHRVKHSSTPTKRDAGSAADGVIILASTLQRIIEESDGHAS